MIWLASYPRSGNTLFRNILFEVYGIPSSDLHKRDKQDENLGFAENEVVKTHFLPDQLPVSLKHAKSIYLIRDGRDAAVSLAHHRKDIKKTNDNYYQNLAEVILGIGGSFSGGWRKHVESWETQADIIIRFEDLIANPIEEVERLRAIMELPAPRKEKLPTFESQKNGIPQYGSGKNRFSTTSEQKEHAQKFFRRGKVGSYKDEMPKAFQWVFWLKNKSALKRFNYK